MKNLISKNKVIKILFIILLLQLAVSCKEKGTEPPQTKPFKNPREMTWTADTLETGDPDQLQILPQNLLVFSSNDAWLCCWADGPLGQMWRYDGKDWTINDIGKDVSGKPADIVGLASNNLWTGGYIGDKVFLARYNGINWIDVYPGFYTVDPSKWLKGDILDMSVDVNGNIWACGRNGLVMKYENNKWISDTVNIFSGYTLSLSLRSTEFYKDKISLISETYDSNHRKYYYYYFSGTIDNWSLVDSMVLENPSSEIRFGNFGLHKGANNELYSFGLEGIWIRTNNIWEKIFDIDGEIYCMYTVNRDYIVTGSAYKKIFFYNGSHWENINDLFEIDDPTFVFKNVWTDGYEIFITGYGSVNNKQGTIIWHGK